MKPSTTIPAAAALYLRISDDREGRELGVERQLKDCEALAKREGLSVVQVYRDNSISASTKTRVKRPGYDQMLKDAKAGKFKVIVAYSSSRLTRKPREHEDLIDLAQQFGIRYRFVVSPSFDLNTADGRHVARMLAANDAAEAERIKERVVREVKDRAVKGEFHGGPRPYGITADGKGLVEEEAALVRGWYAHVIEGGSLSSIRTNLERQGIPSHSGVAWRTPVIRRILLHPRNAGLRVLTDENGGAVTYPTPHPQIVPEQTWQAAKLVLEDPDRRVHQKGPARKHLGTGLFICADCVKTVNIAYDARLIRVYRCLKCFRVWRADPLDDFVNGLVEQRIGAEDARERLLPQPADDTPDVAALRTEATAIGINLKDALEQFMLAKGVIRDALQGAIRKAEQRLEEIDAAITEASRTNVVAGLLAADDPVQAYRDIEDVARRQEIVRLLMTIRLGKSPIGRAKWDAKKFMGGSQWAGDELTWADHWAAAAI